MKHKTCLTGVEGFHSPIKDIQPGRNFTVTLLTNGDVFVSGENKKGSLGLGASKGSLGACCKERVVIHQKSFIISGLRLTYNYIYKSI